MRDAPSTTWALVTTIPWGSTITPEPSDWAWRWRGKKPPKKGSTSRTIASAEMLTTAGDTRSTTRTTGVRRAASAAGSFGLGPLGEGGRRTAAAGAGRRCRGQGRRPARTGRDEAQSHHREQAAEQEGEGRHGNKSPRHGA